MSRRRNPRLKKSHVEQEYTYEQILELKRCATNPIYFIKNYVYIKHPLQGMIHFNLYDYQEDMVDMFDSNRYSMVLASRQVGKTETICAYLLWYSIFHDDKTILVVSNKSDGAKEIIAKIQYAYEELPHWLKPGINEDSWNKHECNFDNHSRILATSTSKDSGRGLAISLLYCDEFAFVNSYMQKEFWTSISPTLSTGGSCIISSTPNGNSNLFADLWRGSSSQHGTNEFQSMHVPWYAPPGRDEKFKKEQIGLLGLRKWLQEYECEFLSSDATLIDNYVLSQIEASLDKIYEDNGGEPPESLKISDGCIFYKKPSKSLTYLVSVDVAQGVGEDYSIINIAEFPTMEQVLEFRSNKITEKELYAKLKNILLFLQQNSSQVLFSVENNGLGASVLALYEYDDKPPAKAHLISNSDKKLGIGMTGLEKRKAAMRFKNIIETRGYKFYSKTLLNEMKSYVKKGEKYEADTGATDDCVAAHLILMVMLEEMAEYDQTAFEKVYSTRGYDSDQSAWDEYTDDPKTLDDMPMPIIFS